MTWGNDYSWQPYYGHLSNHWQNTFGGRQLSIKKYNTLTSLTEVWENVWAANKCSGSASSCKPEWCSQHCTKSPELIRLYYWPILKCWPPAWLHNQVCHSTYNLQILPKGYQTPGMSNNHNVSHQRMCPTPQWEHITSSTNEQKKKP